MTLKNIFYNLILCFFLFIFIGFMGSSCKKKNLIIGKWKLIDKKVSCTNSEKDSIENIMAMEDVINEHYYIFSEDQTYLNKGRRHSVQGKYKIIDSFIALTRDISPIPIVFDGYKIHFMDDNTLQLVEEITNVKNKETFIYTLSLKRE